MRRSRIKAKFRANEPALVVCLHLLDACVYELTSLMGFDGIWMDLEHHPTSLETATTLMRASRVGSTDIVAGHRARRARRPAATRGLRRAGGACRLPHGVELAHGV